MSDSTLDALGLASNPHEDPDGALALRCRWHPTRSAIAHCTRCGALICASCHRVRDHGLAECRDCPSRRAALGAAGPEDEDEPEAQPPTSTPTLLPSDGAPVPLEADGPLLELPLRYIQTCYLAILLPGVLFVRLQASSRWLAPLGAGYASLTLGMAAAALWRMATGAELGAEDPLTLISAQNGIPVRVLEWMMVLLAPIAAGFQVVLGVGLLHLAAKLAGGEGGWLRSTQIYGYSACAFLFHVVPWVGSTLAIMGVIFSQLYGLRVLHGLSLGRAMLAVALPLLGSLLLGGAAL